jgi:hypothetical protein
VKILVKKERNENLDYAEIGNQSEKFSCWTRRTSARPIPLELN